MDIYQLSGLMVTAFIMIAGILKLKLIEEIVKKISGDDKNSKFYSISMLLFVTIVLAAISLQLEQPSNSNEEVIEEISEAEQVEFTDTPKTKSEVNLEIAEKAVVAVTDVAKKLQNEKKRKDSTFLANKTERWAYQFGDWTQDDESIIDMFRKLESLKDDIKLFKAEGRYIFLVEKTGGTDGDLQNFRETFQGISVNLVDLNSFTKRRSPNILTKNERFGRRKRKISVPCLYVD